MKIRTKRTTEKTEIVDILIVYIGENRYRLTESLDGFLTINKSSDGSSHGISLHPIVTNEIQIK
jgi:hypothetical protein